MDNDKVQHLRNEPALRFDLFQDDYRLTNIGRETKKVLSGRTPDKNNSSIWGDEIPWITSGDIHQKYITSGDLYLNENSVKNLGLHLIPKHSVLIGTAGQGKTRCTVGTNERELCTNDAMLSMIPKNDVYYLYLLFLLEGKYQHLRLLTPQETKTRLSTNNLKSFIINLPSLDEQKKVADFVFSVEKKILLLEKKLENLKLFKKGLVEDIFKQLVKEHPLKKLVDISSRMFSGGTPKSTEKLFYGGNISFLTISDITRSSKNLYKASKRITQFGLENSSAKIAMSGTMIYTMYATIAVPIITKIDVAIPQSVMAIKFKDNIDIDFMYYQLASMTNIVRSKFTETGTQGNINSSIVKNLRLVVPNYGRQVEISKNLNNIESKIELLASKLEILKQFNGIPIIDILYNVSIFTLEVNKNEN